MIFITGCARSGTSLTTKILERLGLDIGREQPMPREVIEYLFDKGKEIPDPIKRANINGLFENTDIRDRLVKPYLKDIGVDPLGQNPLADTKNLKPWPALREEVIKAMQEPKEPWGYKCPKITMIWPLWAKAFPEAKFLIVRRNREKIIDSCMRTGFMRAYDGRTDWGEWVDAHVEQFDAMKASVETMEIWPDAYIEDMRAFEPAAAFCDVEFNPGLARKCIDEPRWHSNLPTTNN